MQTDKNADSSLPIFLMSLEIESCYEIQGFIDLYSSVMIANLSIELKGFTRNSEFIVYCSDLKNPHKTWLLFHMHILTLPLEETTCLFDFFRM